MSEQSKEVASEVVGADDFAALEARADAIDAAGVAQIQQQQQVQQKQDDAEAASMVDSLVEVLQLARSMLAAGFAWWPHFGAVWNDGVLRGMAMNGAVIMQRQGWSVGDLMSKWGPYIGLLGVTAPAAYATYQAIQERRRQAAQQQGGAPGVGDQQTAN